MSFSVIIPVSQNHPSKQLKTCLHSLHRQTLPPQEIIIVISPKAKPALFRLLKSLPKIKVFKKTLSKPAARNYGAQKANNSYLVHIDANDTLEKQVLKQAQKLINTKKAKAIIIDEKYIPSSYIARIRNLERNFVYLNPHLIHPQIISASLFKKLHGFDPDIRLLDEWSLHFRLNQNHVKFHQLKTCNLITIPTSLKTIIQRKYQRGQDLPLLKHKYPHQFNQVKTSHHLKNFIIHSRFFLSDPLAAPGLLILKLIEWLAFFLGSLNPPHYNLYQNPSIAQDYDQLRGSTNQRLYRDFCEKTALKKLLTPLPRAALELGAGTGRITQFLKQLGIKVTPTEPASAMLKQYQQKKGLPPPIQASAENLPQNLGKFDLVIAIRLIWHIKNTSLHQPIIHQAKQHSSDSIIFDFTSLRRYRHPLFFLFHRLPALIFYPNAYKHQYFFSLKEIKSLANKEGLRLHRQLPLDLLIPLWLNLLPQSLAQKLFPFLYQLELKLSHLIPPSRWLIKFSK